MELRAHRSTAGFTLIELMIVVAILGILASTAIPSFILYQQRSKRSEAYANLESIRKVQIAYRTEFGAYITASPSPGLSLGADKQNWQSTGDNRFSDDPSGQGFELLGWTPDGPTYFDYATRAGSGSGPRFTAGAYGDVDGDGLVSVFLYAEPDTANVHEPCTFCTDGPSPLVVHTGPPVDDFGDDVWKTVFPLKSPAADDF
jgi:prepilin-type N-terminal cleavage/methylation domain-containing protein